MTVCARPHRIEGAGGPLHSATLLLRPGLRRLGRPGPVWRACLPAARQALPHWPGDYVGPRPTLPGPSRGVTLTLSPWTSALST